MTSEGAWDVGGVSRLEGSGTASSPFAVGTCSFARGCGPRTSSVIVRWSACIVSGFGGSSTARLDD